MKIFGDSIFGEDVNGDGKVDILDDLIIMDILDENEKEDVDDVDDEI